MTCKVQGDHVPKIYFTWSLTKFIRYLETAKKKKIIIYIYSVPTEGDSKRMISNVDEPTAIKTCRSTRSLLLNAFKNKTQGLGLGVGICLSPQGESCWISLVTLHSVAAFVNINLDAGHFDGALGSGFCLLGDHFSLLENNQVPTVH